MKNITEKLVKFVSQKPGLDFCNYGDVKSYRSEMNEITKDRHDFNELLSLALRRIENFEEKLTFNLQKSSGRLTLNENNELDYCIGQYFPTEYRPAANHVIAQLIFNDYRDEKETNSPNPVYNTGQEIRKAISKNVSKRVMRNYFN
jgi:hypothetical protein